MGHPPDVSDLLQTIDEARVLEAQFRAADRRAVQAMARLIERYESAGVTAESCDHPLYCHRCEDSMNVCCFCQRPLDAGQPSPRFAPAPVDRPRRR
jgi:hypothetical protein